VATGLCYNPMVYNITNPQPAMSTLVLTGSLTLSSLPNVGVPGATVSITSPTLGKTLCETVADNQGQYQCRAVFPTPTASQLELRYRVRGRGPAVERSVMMTSPVAQVTKTEVQDFQLNPQRVLHLTGVTKTTPDAPIESNVTIAGIDTVEFKTAADGKYDAYLPLPDGTNLVQLAYKAVSLDGSKRVAVTSSLNASQVGVTEAPLDLTLLTNTTPPDPDTGSGITPVAPKIRTFTISGRVLNGLANSAPIAKVPVSITAPGVIDPTACQLKTSSIGMYSCTVTLKNGDPFSVNISAYGGQVSSNLNVGADDVPALGASLSKQIPDLEIKPVVIHFMGTVRGGGAVLPSASVGIRVKDQATYSFDVGLQAATTGVYEGTLTIPEPVVAPLNLNYDVVYFANRSSKALTITSEPGVITEVPSDLEVNTRNVVFAGKVGNALLDGAGVFGATVTITRTSPTRLPVCVTTTDQNGLYSCGYALATGEAFDAELVVSGFGTAKIEGLRVDPAATSGLQIPVEQNFTVSPTSIQVTGLVSDKNGLPASNAIAKLVKDGVTVPVKANAQGRYTAVWNLSAQDPLTGSLEISTQVKDAANQTVSTLENLNFTAIRDGLVSLTQDLKLNLNFDSDVVRIHGNILNLTAGDAEGLDLTVTGVGQSADLGVFCQGTVGQAGAYYCNDKAMVRRSKLDLEYVLSIRGQPVSAPVQASFNLIPGGTNVISLTRDVEIAPAMLLVQGRVTNQLDQPIVDAQVSVKTPFQKSVQTDAQGDYETTIPVPLSSLTGKVTARIEYGRDYRSGNANVAVQTFVAEAGKLTELLALTTKMPFTVLTVNGTVKAVSGAAIQNVSVTVKGDNIGEKLVKTDGDGAYSVPFDINSSLTQVGATIVASNGLNSQTETVTGTIVPVGPNVFTKDFVLDVQEPGVARWSTNLTTGTVHQRVAGTALSKDGHLYAVTGVYPGSPDYYGATGTRLYAINTDGSIAWSTVFSGSPTAPAITDDGTIIFGSGPQLNYVKPDGTTLRSVTLPDAGNSYAQLSNLALAPDGTAYVVGNFKLYAIAPDGQFKWAYQAQEYNPYQKRIDLVQMLGPVQLDADGAVHVPGRGSYSSSTYVLNADGTDNTRYRGSPFVLSDDLTIVRPNGYSIARLVNGEQTWSFDSYDPTNQSGVISADGELYVRSSAGLSRVDVITGTIKQTWPATAGTEVWSLKAIGTDGTIYGTASRYKGNYSQYVVALKKDGTVLWGYLASREPIQYQINQNGDLYFAHGNTITALSTTSAGLAESARPIVGLNNQNTNRSPTSTVPKRLVRFTGTVSNLNESGSTLPGFTVQLKTAAGKPLCTGVSNAQGRYSCAAMTSDLSETVVNVLASREYSYPEQTATLPAGPAGSETQIEQNIAVPITTLALAGTVKDSNGAGIAGASVVISGGANITLTTDAQGRYSNTFTYGPYNSNFVLDLRVKINGVTVGANTSGTVITGGLETRTVDLTVDPNRAGVGQVWRTLSGDLGDVLLGDDGVTILSTGVGAAAEIQAVNPDGTLRWTYGLPYNAAIPKLAMADDGTIYVAGGGRNYWQPGYLIALTSAGAQKWVFALPALAQGLAVGHDGKVVTGSNNAVYAINADGTQAWVRSGVGMAAFTIGTDGAIMIGGGTVLNPDGTIRSSQGFGIAPAIGADGTIYGYTANGNTKYLTAFKSNRSIKWRTEIGTYYGYPNSVAIGGNGVVYVAGTDFLAAVTADGTRSWQLTGTNFSKLAIGADQLIYVSNTQGQVMSVNPDGTLNWQYNSGQASLDMAPLITSTGGVYLATREVVNGEYKGVLTKINSTALGLVVSPWPRTGHDQRNTARAPFIDIPRRTVRFSGVTQNAFVPAIKLVNHTVNLSNEDGTLCEAITDQSGQYACTAVVETANAFEAEAVVSGPLVSKAFPVSVSAGADGSVSEVTTTLDVPVTTLRVEGILTDETGRALPNLSVNVSDYNQEPVHLPYQAGGQTDAAGRFSFEFMYASGTTDHSISVNSDDGFNYAGSNLLVNITENVLTVAVQNLVIDRTQPGGVRWKLDLNGAIGAPAVASDGTVYVAASSRLYAIDPVTRVIKWTANYESEISPMIGDDGTIYVASSGKLTAVNPNGSLRWQISRPQSTSYYKQFGLALGKDGSILWQNASDLYWLEAATGTQRWVYSSTEYEGFDATPVVDQAGDVYVASKSTLFSLNPLDGTERWTFSSSSSSILAMAIMPNGNIALLGERTGQSYMLDVHVEQVSTAGAGVSDDRVGETYSGYYSRIRGSMVVSGDGSVYWDADPYSVGQFALGSDGTVYATKDGPFIATDVNGDQLWSASPSINGFALGSNGLVYGVGYNGLYAINTEGTGLATSGWPRAGGNNQNTGRQVP
jgi:hypothetical protein